MSLSARSARPTWTQDSFVQCLKLQRGIKYTMALQRVGSQQPALRGHQRGLFFFLFQENKTKIYLQNIALGGSRKHFSYLWSGPFPLDKYRLLSSTHNPALPPALGGAPVHMVFWWNNKCICTQPQPSRAQMPATEGTFEASTILGRGQTEKRHWFGNPPEQAVVFIRKMFSL